MLVERWNEDRLIFQVCGLHWGTLIILQFSGFWYFCKWDLVFLNFLIKYADNIIITILRLLITLGLSLGDKYFVYHYLPTHTQLCSYILDTLVHPKFFNFLICGIQTETTVISTSSFFKQVISRCTVAVGLRKVLSIFITNSTFISSNIMPT